MKGLSIKESNQLSRKVIQHHEGSIIIGEKVPQYFTARACQAALGIKIGQEQMLEPIH